MATHPLRGYARWIVFPAIPAAAGALAFVGGKSPFEGGPLMGALVGLAPGLALAISPRIFLGGLLALALVFLGAFAVAFSAAVPPTGADEILRGLFRLEVPNLALAGATLAPALLQGWRLREGVSWWWPNLFFQALAGLLVPAVMWWFNVPVEMGTFFSFVVLAGGHVVGVEAASFASPRLE